MRGEKGAGRGKRRGCGKRKEGSTKGTKKSTNHSRKILPPLYKKEQRKGGIAGLAEATK
jgi:hypothetical protein